MFTNQPLTGRLVIIVDGDFTKLESGSHTRFREQIDFALKNFDEVVVYAYSNHPSLPWSTEGQVRFATLFPDAILILEKQSRGVATLTKIKRLALKLLPKYARLILCARLPRKTPRFTQLAVSGAAFLINFVDQLPMLNGYPSRSVVAIDTQDAKFVKAARWSGAPIYSLPILAKLRSELGCLATCDAILSISVYEDVLFRTFFPEKRHFLIPTFAFLSRGMLTKPMQPIFTYDLLFVGSDYHFNAIGLIGFLNESRAWLRGRRIAVAGKVCSSPELVRLASHWPEIALLGYVNDLSELYLQCKLALCPVNGTGLKIKIVDALCNGVPVVASAQAMEGLIPGYKSCVFGVERTQIEGLLEDEGRLFRAREAIAVYLELLQADDDKAGLCALLQHAKVEC